MIESGSQNKWRGIFYGFVSTLTFGTMAMMVKEGQKSFTIWQLIFARSIVSMVLIYLLAGRRRVWGGQRKLLLLARGVLGVLAISLSFFALHHLTLVNASVLFQTSPLFIFLLSHIYLNEKVSLREWLLLFVAFVGIGLVLKPNLGIMTWPALGGLLGAFFAGMAHTIIRALRRTDGVFTIVFYYSVVATVATAPLALADWHWPRLPLEWAIILSLGFLATMGQLFLTKAYALAEARKVAMVKYISIPFAAVMGFLLWHEIPGVWTILGSLLIIAALVRIELEGARQSRLSKKGLV